MVADIGAELMKNLNEYFAVIKSDEDRPYRDLFEQYQQAQDSYQSLEDNYHQVENQLNQDEDELDEAVKKLVKTFQKKDGRGNFPYAFEDMNATGDGSSNQDASIA